ncbi:MAG: hypothetical protein JST35_00625 [Armatimonadetes bacterium]|nr:hypothetical protein [Armatimonadota bacterium]
MRPAALLPFALLTSLAYAGPKRITTFADMMKSLESDSNVRVVFHYAKLKLTSEGKEVPAPDAIGGMTLDNWEYFAPGVVRNKLGYLATSQTVLIAHPGYGTVLNYVRVRINSDGTVQVTARYYDPTTYKVVMDETFNGAISNGKDANGVSLFVN